MLLFRKTGKCGSPVENCVTGRVVKCGDQSSVISGSLCDDIERVHEVSGEKLEVKVRYSSVM